MLQLTCFDATSAGQLDDEFSRLQLRDADLRLFAKKGAVPDSRKKYFALFGPR